MESENNALNKTQQVFDYNKIQDLGSKNPCREGPRQRDSEMYALSTADRGLTCRILLRTQEKQRKTRDVVSKSSAQNLVGPLLHHNLAVSTASHSEILDNIMYTTFIQYNSLWLCLFAAPSSTTGSDLPSCGL